MSASPVNTTTPYSFSRRGLKRAFLDNYPFVGQVVRMHRLRLVSSVEQVEAHLRAELAAGRWRGLMPGVLRLEAELGVNRKTVEAGLRMLEKEGLLAPQGAGRRRRIVPPKGAGVRLPLRVALLLYESVDAGLSYIVDLRHLLDEDGHTSFVAPRTLRDLDMDVRRVSRLVKETRADAWVVAAGSHDVLKWFADQPAIPAFALFGRRHGLPIAGIGPDKSPAFAAAARRLVGLGHRRICMLVRRERRLPEPGVPEKAFLSELESGGIRTGAYNLPDWEESAEGFRVRLDSLFRTTPPTALMIDGAGLFFAAQLFLMNRGLRVPGDVSLICADNAPHFAWCRPSITHIRWDSRPVVGRILRWASNISRGKPDVRQSLTRVELVPGGTIGPASEPPRRVGDNAI